MKILKNKFIFPLLVFLLCISILSGISYNVSMDQKKQKRINAHLNAITYAEHIKTDILQGIHVTDTLKQILISNDGHLDKFDSIAKNMMTSYIQSIQIAPNGVVTNIYPIKGNKAGMIDLLHDKERGKICRYAKNHHTLTMQGPFQLKQGGMGIAIRNPVYLTNPDGSEYFWGFTIIIIKVPEIFSDSIKALSSFGYNYKLSKTISPWNTKYQTVYKLGKSLKDPVSYKFNMGQSQWKLEVVPKNGWFDNTKLYFFIISGLIIVLLLTGLTYALLVLNAQREKLKKTVITDELTGINNRHGFDECVSNYLAKHPSTNCVAAQFDIDNFKSINDVYGHATGDSALKALASSMQSYFDHEVILGRNGGDEFCIFLPNCTYKDIQQKIEKFTSLKRTFNHQGQEHTFSISLGYAQYPVFANTLSQLMRCADAALYEVKLHGKNNCLAYHKGLQLGIRTQLGFVLKDISENLPGAFIIYRADRTTSKILFANREFLNLSKSNSMDELIHYTNGSFQNLILESERDSVKEKIWNQIESGNINDYVKFHLIQQDGSAIQVLDYGRIVESERYGMVFYVFLMSVEKIKKNMKDEF